MAFQKKTKEQWEAEAKTKALQKAVDNVQLIKDSAKAAGIGAESKSEALLMLLISELMNVNNNLYWIQTQLKKQGGGYQSAANDEVRF